MDDTIDSTAETAVSGKAPWHLWVVGVVSLLWNCIGAYDYTMTHAQGAAYMAEMGMDADSVGYVMAFPAWVTAGWALGVWGAVVGSVLLLVRSRYAVWAFAISLLGVALMTIYNLTHTLPATMTTPAATAFDWAIKLIAVLLLWYAWTQRKRGVLR